MTLQQPPFDFALLAERGIAFNTFESGEKIFLEDDTGDCMYVVRSGRVDIITFGTVLDNVGPNGMFGEMALIDDSPRSAAAIAHERTEVARIDKDTFVYLVQKDPEFALRVMSLLAVRIRRMNESI